MIKTQNTMKAAVWYGVGAENFRIESVDCPKPTASEVLIKVTKCYFSAMHARAILVGHAKHTPPLIFGRMLAGEVATVGSKVTGIRAGMRVTANPEKPCGNCFYCLRKEAGHCLNPIKLQSGGMAEYVLIPADLVDGIYELSPTVPDAFAAFAETLACVLQGIELAQISISDSIVILGDGGVGLSFVQLAKLQGAKKIIIAGKHEDSLEQAKILGATNTVNITKESLEKTVMEETQGYGADVVFEAVGSEKTYQDAISLLRCGGSAIGFGGTSVGTQFKIEPNLIHYRSLKIYGSYRYFPHHFRKAIELIDSGLFKMEPIVTHFIPFSKLTTDAVNIHQQPNCRALVIDF